MATVTEQAGITLSELLDVESDFNADDIYLAIAPAEPIVIDEPESEPELDWDELEVHEEF